MTPNRTVPPHLVAYDPPKWWSTAEFDRLVDLGIIEEGCDTYLWEGQIVVPPPQCPPYINACAHIHNMLMDHFEKAAWTINYGAPLDIEDGTKPQPDVMVAKGPRSGYRVKVPTPSDLALLVQVSDNSTYARDSGERYLKYASAGISHYWIVNVARRRVEVHTEPRGSADGNAAYRSRVDHGLRESIPLDVHHVDLVVTGQIAVIDILRDSLGPA